MTCQRCKGSGWILKHCGEEVGAKKCPDCSRPPAQPPKELSRAELAALSAAATEASHRLGSMADYPHALDQLARKDIAEALCMMCSSVEQIDFVRRRARDLFPSWKQCGVPGLRQILVNKYRPRDGIDSGPAAISELYPEGLPSEKDGMTGYQAEQQRVAPPRPLKLLSSGDSKLDAAVKELAQSKKIKPLEKPTLKVAGS